MGSGPCLQLNARSVGRHLTRMVFVKDIEDPRALSRLGTRIRASSNFRFEWQWVGFSEVPGDSRAFARALIDSLIQDPACHRFLRESFVPMYAPRFEMEALHEHCSFDSNAGAVESLLAHLFTNWFHGVAWDWCVVGIWRGASAQLGRRLTRHCRPGRRRSQTRAINPDRDP